MNSVDQVNLWIEILQINRYAAVAEVLFHLGDGVILEVGDGGHQDCVRAAVNYSIVKVLQCTRAAGL